MSNELRPPVLAACRRNQTLAVVIDLGTLVCARRARCHRRTRSAHDVEFLLRCAADFGVTRVVVESGDPLVEQLGARGVEAVEVSIRAIKTILGGPARTTHRRLSEIVLNRYPALRRFAVRPTGHPVILDQPDRWRTVVFLAAALALAVRDFDNFNQ